MHIHGMTYKSRQNKKKESTCVYFIVIERSYKLHTISHIFYFIYHIFYFIYRQKSARHGGSTFEFL